MTCLLWALSPLAVVLGTALVVGWLDRGPEELLPPRRTNIVNLAGWVKRDSFRALRTARRDSAGRRLS